MQRDPLVYLDDILHACRNIQRYTRDLTFEQFDGAAAAAPCCRCPGEAACALAICR